MTCDWVHSGAVLMVGHIKIGIPIIVDFQLLDSELILESIFKEKVSLGAPNTAPPELTKFWQFAFRTALPVRAPSALS
jgi:hypothetical protein